MATNKLEHLVKRDGLVDTIPLSTGEAESGSTIRSHQDLLEDSHDSDLSKDIAADTVTPDRFFENGTFVGSIDAEQDVVYSPDGDVVVGSVDAAGDAVGFVSYRSDEGSVVAGSIDAEKSVLYESEGGSVVAGSIDAEKSVLSDSDGGSVVAGSIDSGEVVLLDSEGGSVVAGSIDADWSVLYYSGGGGSVVAGSIDAKGDVFSKSEGGSVVAGSIDAGLSVLYDSRGGSVWARYIHCQGLLVNSSQSYVIAEDVVAESIGEGSKESLLVAKTVEGDIREGIGVISAEEGIGLTYRGDWNSLTQGLEPYLNTASELLETLGPFRLDGEVDTVEGLQQELDAIIALYQENEIREGYRMLEECRDVLGLDTELRGSNEQRAEQLRNIDNVVCEAVQSQYGVRDSNATRLLDASHPGYVLEKVDKVRSRSGSLDGFIETFHGGSDVHADIGFEVEYYFDSSSPKELTEDVRAHNEELYESGVELIEQIRDGNTGGFDIRDGEYDQMQEELASLSERIGEAFREGDQEKGQYLIKEKRGLENEVERLANTYQDEVLDRMGIGEPRNLSLGELREGLNQLYQEHLDEGSKVYRRAQHVANNIETEAAEIGDNTVRVTTWDKDIRNLPSYEDYNACIFPGPYDEMNGMLIDLMADQDAQLLYIRAGEHEGMAITTLVQDDRGRDQLLVDSVQSSSNIFKRRGVTEAVDRAIGDYARRQGVDEVLYNASPHNTAPKQFLENLDYSVKKTSVEKDDPAVDRRMWLGTELSGEFYHRAV